MAQPTKPRPPKDVEAEIRQLLGAALPDAELRDRLDVIAQEPGFHGVPMTVWAPALYRRHRVLFRPFILSHFSTATWFGHKWSSVTWKSQAAVLEPWLLEVDEQGDVLLFKRLYTWKVWSGGSRATADRTWRQEVLRRMRSAGTRHERQQVLERFDLPAALDEETATELYGLDPDAAGRFILNHLPVTWTGNRQRTLWRALYEHASGRDSDFALALYRRQAPVEEWRQEIRRLCRQILDAAELSLALEKRHLEGWPKGIGPGFLEVLEARGRDAFPYVVRHLRDLTRAWIFGDGYRPLLKLAAGKGWWDLWSEVLRTCASAREFDDAVETLVKERTLPVPEVRRRLSMLAGVSREWNFGPWGLAQVHALSDRTSVELYQRFPDLVRTVFKPHVGARWGKPYVDLIAAARDAGDEDLLDYLASRVLIVFQQGSQREVADLLSADLERLQAEPGRLARRAANVLAQVPAFTIPDYDALLRDNRLARLLFERTPESYLAAPAVVRDLLEAPEIHVQALGFRIASLPDERARIVARDNVDLLQAALFRPLHRRTRLLAFDALRNAATALEPGRRVAARAREALDLPDRRYPKEKLVGLIGQLLHQWPELRGPRERPSVRRPEARA